MARKKARGTRRKSNGRVFPSKKNKKFCAVSKDNKWLGCEDTRKDALRLLRKRKRK